MPAPANRLADLPLDCLIGADRPQPGRPSRVTETPYGEPPPAIRPFLDGGYSSTAMT